MKKFTLKFLQIAWVAELIAIELFTMVAMYTMSAEMIKLWLEFLPLFHVLIGAQGGAAFGGPLLSDKINKAKEGNGE